MSLDPAILTGIVSKPRPSVPCLLNWSSGHTKMIDVMQIRLWKGRREKKEASVRIHLSDSFPLTHQYPHANSDEMTPTTQLRALRICLQNHTITLPVRTSVRVAVASQRHVQPCHVRTRRAFVTSTSLLSVKQQAISTVAQYNAAPTRIPSAQSAISPTAANPPATTRPPPLELPERSPETSNFSHLYKTGKAYLSFYKAGLKNIYLNSRLVWSLDSAGGIPTDSSSPPAVAKPPVKRVPEHGSTTRARQLLKRRWAHDARRLPIFALILLICGELTPFVVLALPRAVPFTCRIPRQVESLQRKTEKRRSDSFARLAMLQETQQQLGKSTTTAHIARSLNICSPLWDRLGVPDAVLSLFTAHKVRAHVAFLEEDTRLLRQAGGVHALEDAEIVLACVDRGINVLGMEVPQLRSRLQDWMKQVHRGGSGSTGVEIQASLVKK